jgi:quercetin dioxygenase-like cupin family protein
MQRLVTGIDENGRSCVVSREQPEAIEGGPGISIIDTMVDIGQNPPPPRPAGNGDFHDLGVGPGLLRWMVLAWEPGAEFTMHHTDTVDLDTVLAGSMQLRLDDGTHQLEPGDCVVVNGVDHAWRAGPDGCTMSFAVYGTPAP